MKKILKNAPVFFLFLFAASLVNPVFGQDTQKVAPTDTTQHAAADTTAKKEKANRKRKDSFVVYIGANANELSVSPDQFNSDTELGYQLGFNYRRGKFLYWGAGAKYTNAIYGLKAVDSASDSSSISVKSIDIPLTVGLDLLFFTSRLFTVRTFVGVVPSFVLNVTDDSGLDITKDDLNTFNLLGQGGIGIDIAFLDIELGYNLGFQDVLKDQESKPGQAFVNLGFRF